MNKDKSKKYDLVSISLFIFLILVFIFGLFAFGSDTHPVVPNFEALLAFDVVWLIFSLLTLWYFFRLKTSSGRKGGIIIFIILILILLITSFAQYRSISDLNEKLKSYY